MEAADLEWEDVRELTAGPSGPGQGSAEGPACGGEEDLREGLPAYAAALAAIKGAGGDAAAGSRGGGFGGGGEDGGAGGQAPLFTPSPHLDRDTVRGLLDTMR